MTIIQQLTTTCTLYFNQDLRPFLKTNQSQITYPLTRRANIKDILEALGIPHTEVGKIILHNRAPAKKELTFSYLPQPGDRLEVLAHVPPLDPTQPTLLIPKALGEIRFIVDVNVGKLSRLLRLLGLDTQFHWQQNDQEIAQLACKEKRIVLTKDLGLLKRNQIQWGHFVRASQPRDQLLEVLNFYGLKPPFKLFSRCLACNTPLKKIPKTIILNRLQPKTELYFHKFKYCPRCAKIFWPGSHQERMSRMLKDLGII